MKIAFLDRDGTIVSDYPDQGWSHVIEPEFLPGAREGLESLNAHNFQIIIITNQYLINEGTITLEQYNNFTNKMLDQLAQWNIPILDIFYCPHRRDQACNCCKPKPGMILAACERYPKIQMELSILVGNSYTDIALAEQFQLRSFAIGFDPMTPRAIRVESLAEIVNYL